MSALKNLTRAFSLRAFSRATARASSLMSMAETLANFMASANETAMQPEPVPISSMRKSASGFSSTIMSISPAVSGRGMSVAGVTLK